MEVKGFNENEISEENKEALQSETWQAVRSKMKGEIRHFTDELLKDDPYGYPWEQVVDAYLKSGYKKCSQNELTVLGETYKVLRREEVTVFYDAAGNTLFDVVNERLEKEYGWLMNDSAKAGETLEKDDLNDEEDVKEEENGVIDQEDADLKVGEDRKIKRAENQDDNGISMGEESSKEGNTEFPVPVTEDVVTTEVEDSGSVKEKAREKLEKELKAVKDKNFAEPVIGYLLKRCEEDEGLAQDVVQEHKTWKKCFDYIYSHARKQSKGNYAVVRDDVVYEWAEDYYHKDDKAEEEKKAKEEAEKKARQKKETEERKARAKEKTANTTKGFSSNKDQNADDTTQKERPKAKRNSKDMEGQLDLFSMMGM